MEKMWKLKVEEIIRSFMWMLGHGRLLKNQRKNTKGMGGATYNLCENVCETTLHVFWNRPKAMQLWMNKVPENISQDCFWPRAFGIRLDRYYIRLKQLIIGVSFGRSSVIIFGVGATKRNMKTHMRDLWIRVAMWLNR